MGREFEDLDEYLRLAKLVLDAPTIRFKFKLREEIAAKRGVRREGCDFVRALELPEGRWAILGLLESEAIGDDPAPLFITTCSSAEEMEAGMDGVLERMLMGTMGELLV